MHIVALLLVWLFLLLSSFPLDKSVC